MIADKIIQIAKSYIGEQEILGNKGFKDAQFQKDMEQIGWNFGDPWCADFAKLCWFKAYNGTRFAAYIGLMTGSALGTYYTMAHDKEFTVSQTPVPGAIVIFKEGTDPAKHTGHAGIVTERMGNQFKSIEGNTSDSADIREGYIVAEKVHVLNQPPNPNGLNIIGFIIPNQP